MNKTAVVLGYFGLALVCIVAVAGILLYRPESADSIIQFVGTIMGIASTGAVTFYMIGKTNEKLEKVDKQTNGTLSKLREENDRLTAQLIQATEAKHKA